jgi:predicted DNA-binding transcriptional regulator AlpA
MRKTDEPLHDLEWLSGYLGNIPQRTIYNWRQRGGGPPAYRVGKYLRYRRSEVDAWLDSKRDAESAR